MDDLVVRLHRLAAWQAWPEDENTVHEAADEIDRLRFQNRCYEEEVDRARARIESLSGKNMRLAVWIAKRWPKAFSKERPKHLALVNKKENG